jgi:hypothetical protein
MLHKRNRRLFHAIVNVGRTAIGRTLCLKGASEFAHDLLCLGVPAIVHKAFLVANPVASLTGFDAWHERGIGEQTLSVEACEGGMGPARRP